MAAYEKLLIVINPTKEKFRFTLLNHIYYDLLRMFSNELEKENSVLFVMGFSFADEHIREIALRAANSNPTLIIYILAHSSDSKKELNGRLDAANCRNRNIEIIAPDQKEDPPGSFVDTFSYDFAAINSRFLDPLSKSVWFATGPSCKGCSMIPEQVLEDAIFTIGKVVSVEGRTIRVKVDKTKNTSHLIYKGELLRNVSVGGYIKILKGFTKIIGKVEGEFVAEDKFYAKDKGYRSERDIVDRVLTVSLLGFFDGERFERESKRCRSSITNVFFCKRKNSSMCMTSSRKMTSQLS